MSTADMSKARECADKAAKTNNWEGHNAWTNLANAWAYIAWVDQNFVRVVQQ